MAKRKKGRKRNDSKLRDIIKFKNTENTGVPERRERERKGKKFYLKK